MESAFSNLQIKTSIKVVLVTMTYMERGCINTTMETCLMDYSVKEKGKGWVYSRELMEDIKRENGLMINFRFD
jgi:hypothetical protein